MQAKLDAQEKHAREDSDRLRELMEEKLTASQRMYEEVKRAGPEERKALELQATKLQSELRRSQEQHQDAQRLLHAQLEEREQTLKRLMREIEEKNREVQRARNYNFGSPVRTMIPTRCLHPR